MDLMKRYLTHVLDRPLHRAKRGDRMDAYRKIALRFGVSESAPRMWMAHEKIPRHVARQMEAELGGKRTPEMQGEVLDFDPAVLVAARDVQVIFDLTHGRGEVWRSLLAAISLGKTWARRGRAVGQQHLRILPRR